MLARTATNHLWIGRGEQEALPALLWNWAEAFPYSFLLWEPAEFKKKRKHPQSTYDYLAFTAGNDWNTFTTSQVKCCLNLVNSRTWRCRLCVLKLWCITDTLSIFLTSSYCVTDKGVDMNECFSWILLLYAQCKSVSLLQACAWHSCLTVFRKNALFVLLAKAVHFSTQEQVTPHTVGEVH